MARYYLILLVAFAVVLSCGAENNIRGGDLVSVEEETAVDGVPSDRRRLFSWWSLLFLLGPLGPPINCDHPRPPGPLGHHYDEVCNAQNSSEATSAESESDGVSYYSSQESTGGSSSEAGGQSTASRATWWPLAVAAGAAMTALAAILVGQRKGQSARHPLQASVKRRMGLFENFADRTLCARERPDRVVEMTNSKDDYRLA